MSQQHHPSVNQITLKYHYVNFTQNSHVLNNRVSGLLLCAMLLIQCITFNYIITGESGGVNVLEKKKGCEKMNV